MNPLQLIASALPQTREELLDVDQMTEIRFNRYVPYPKLSVYRILDFRPYNRYIVYYMLYHHP